MLFAMPARGLSFSQHFSKASQIMLWDSETNTKQVIELPNNSQCCGHKKSWNKVLQDHKVDAVVVRLIGTNMLSTLFKNNIRVLSAPRDFDLNSPDLNQLTPVTNIEFARPSAKKNKSCCSGHADEKRVASNKQKSANKLSPRVVNQLNKVLKLTSYAE